MGQSGLCRHYRTSRLTHEQDGKPKEEIELKDDDPRLVRLMIDYLYQMDYDDLAPSKNSVEAPAEEVAADAASPILEPVAYQEHQDVGHAPAAEAIVGEVHWADEPATLGPVEAPETVAVEDEWSAFFTKKKSKKDKKKRKSRPHLPDTGGDLDVARLTVNAKMYALADKYDIPDLKALAKVKFEEAVLQDWESLAFAHAAELVFETTYHSDQGLRSVVISTIDQHRSLVNYEEVQNLMNSGNGMAWALVQILLADGK